MARRAALWGLAFVAVAWGTSFAVVRSTVAAVDPASLVGWRFAVAAAVLVLVRPRTVRDISSGTLRHGLLLGGLLGVGFLACTVGLRTTPASTTAFVVGSGVALAPAIGWVWGRRRPVAAVMVAVPVCLLGLGLVTLPGLQVDRGVGLVAVAAACWTVHLVALQRWVRPGQVWASALVQTATVAMTAFGARLATGGGIDLPVVSSDRLGLLFLGVVATAAAFVVLTWSELHVDATTAALVLTLEPVAGAVAGVWSGESLSRTIVTGGALVVLSALLAARGTGQPWAGSRHARGIASVSAWRSTPGS